MYFNLALNAWLFMTSISSSIFILGVPLLFFLDKTLPRKTIYLLLLPLLVLVVVWFAVFEFDSASIIKSFFKSVEYLLYLLSYLLLVHKLS